MYSLITEVNLCPLGSAPSQLVDSGQREMISDHLPAAVGVIFILETFTYLFTLSTEMTGKPLKAILGLKKRSPKFIFLQKSF
jgi:hypothetical protein